LIQEEASSAGVLLKVKGLGTCPGPSYLKQRLL